MRAANMDSIDCSNVSINPPEQSKQSFHTSPFCLAHAAGRLRLPDLGKTYA